MATAGLAVNCDTIGEVDLEVHQKYDIKRRIGKGAYGIVWQAVDRQSGKVVAVKKIFDAFRNRTDAQRTYREVMFLQQFGHHPNITTLLGVMRAKNDLDLYLILEYMECDLHQVIRRTHLLKDVHIRYIMYQLLKALQFLHSANVIHRDQKPSNILLDSDCHVRVADFGLARSLSQLEDDDPLDPTMTEYVATRWYRAPEILLADKSYTTGVDMWSVGCILGEMLTGKPLFPGSSTLNQIERIMSAIQPPTWAEIVSMCSGYAVSILERANNKPKRPLMEIMPTAPYDAMDLLQKLLVFCPEKRISAAQALKHPYVNRFYSDETCPREAETTLPRLREESHLSISEYRQRLYQLEVNNDNSDATPRLNNDLRAIEVWNDDDDCLETVRETCRRPTEPAEESAEYNENNETEHTATFAVDTFTTASDNEECNQNEIYQSDLNEREASESPVVSKDTNSNSILNKYMAATYIDSQRTPAQAPATAAGLPSHHPRANSASAWLRFHQHYNAATAVYKPTIQQKHKRPVTDGAAKGTYGRKQFSNFGNASSLGPSKVLLHNYNQSHGTITASALQRLKISK